jgi:hypothetical protein
MEQSNDGGSREKSTGRPNRSCFRRKKMLACFVEQNACLVERPFDETTGKE